MVGFELESKFLILKNARSFQDDVLSFLESAGYKPGQCQTVDQVDVYQDQELILYKAGFSLRYRYKHGRLGKITLKTLDHFDDNGHIRIEEEAETLPQLSRMVVNKLRSIFQEPADEKVIELLGLPGSLKPVVILVNHRESYDISHNGKTCEMSFDTVTYLYPGASSPVCQLEIEGPRDFDTMRSCILKRYGSGRWQTIGLTTTSKFEYGLKLGGAI